jgi:oligopeptide/dipeptide ABC transporter ATP-binding protein
MLLCAEGLTRRYPGSGRRAEVVRAVDGIDLSIAAGETVGLVGESGCGKSTTARLLMRLIPVSDGTISFEGRDITHARGRQLADYRRAVQMVFQDPYSSLNPRRTVGSIIEQPLRHVGLEPDRQARRRNVQQLMERVGLNPEHYNRYPHDFSGGQRQRIGIARALASRPRVIIADEPVSALDVSIQAQILNLLSDLRRDLALAMLFIAHDLSVVRHMCDRVCVMYMGQIVEQAPARELFKAPSHPYTAALLDAIPKPDPECISECLDVREVPPTEPVAQAHGCRYAPRCSRAHDNCWREQPMLEPAHGDARQARCHYPLLAAEGERTRERPTVSP